MIVAVADTHAAVWHVLADARISPQAEAVISSAAANGEHVAISAISFVEIVYLMERGRIPPTTLRSVLALVGPQHVFLEAPLDQAVVQVMLTVSSVAIPEMPDRIVAATGVLLGVPILTADQKSRASQVPTIW